MDQSTGKVLTLSKALNPGAAITEWNDKIVVLK